MEQVTISEIKSHLSAYLKKVRAGETVVILDRNRPGARVEPIVPEEHPQNGLARLEREGVVRRSSGPLPLALLRSQARKPKRSALSALL